jgi:hypothetical protein
MRHAGTVEGPSAEGEGEDVLLVLGLEMIDLTACFLMPEENASAAVFGKLVFGDEFVGRVSYRHEEKMATMTRKVKLC